MCAQTIALSVAVFSTSYERVVLSRIRNAGWACIKCKVGYDLRWKTLNGGSMIVPVGPAPAWPETAGGI